jgi:hypothetical protein
VEEWAVGTLEVSALSAVTGQLQSCIERWDELSEAERLELIGRALRSANQAVSSVTTSIDVGARPT